ncbi:Cyclic nucleotide-gated ion channel 1 [Capsicum annuum]|nr:Cyclic nucleotide-gated ion channel 1 [Capsicum annuum]
MSTIRRGIERGFDGTSGLIRKLLLIHSLSRSLRKVSGSSRNKILDPQEPFLQFWNKIFILACIISVAIDPLFLYILVIDSKKKCIDLDHTLRIPISILRSVTDLFYVYHIVQQFRTGFIAPSSRVFGRGELIEDPYLTAKRYFSSYFFIDILAVLPLPQIVLFIITPNMNRRISLATKELLEIVILAQWIPRIFRMIPLNKEITRTTGFFTETALAAAALILFQLMIVSNSITVRVEGMRLRRQDAEQWMSHRLLPDNLRERIRSYEQYKWQQTRGVDEDYLISNLPKDLKRDIKCPLCWSLLKRVPMFEKMDEQLLDALCDLLKPVLFTENSFIIREGDPVNEMLFVMRGTLLTMTTNGGRTGFFNSASLKAGDFCGEELLTWALDPNASSTLPASTRTVRAVIDVEAFALTADDLKFVAAQFRRFHSKQLRHTFRFYSQHWRTWAACFIQAAWRRHYRNKLVKSLREEEDRLQAALANETATLPSLGATIYASKFAANMLRALRRNHPRGSKSSTRLSPLLLQKPAEPDFGSSS